jgi:hypothetical protein
MLFLAKITYKLERRRDWPDTQAAGPRYAVFPKRNEREERREREREKEKREREISPSSQTVVLLKIRFVAQVLLVQNLWLNPPSL